MVYTHSIMYSSIIAAILLNGNCLDIHYLQDALSTLPPLPRYPRGTEGTCLLLQEVLRGYSLWTPHEFCICFDGLLLCILDTSCSICCSCIQKSDGNLDWRLRWLVGTNTTSAWHKYCRGEYPDSLRFRTEDPVLNNKGTCRQGALRLLSSCCCPSPTPLLQSFCSEAFY